MPVSVSYSLSPGLRNRPAPGSIPPHLQDAAHAGAEVLVDRFRHNSTDGTPPSFQARPQRIIAGQNDDGRAYAAILQPLAYITHTGTARRQTLEGLNRGRVRPNPYIRRAINGSLDNIRQAAADSLRQSLPTVYRV